jgi:predicted aspartyl protease
MNDARYPSLPIRLTIGSSFFETTALVDSGFEGYIALPRTLASSLPTPRYERRAEMASGEIVTVPVWRGTAELVDAPGSFRVDAVALGDEFLIGLFTMNFFKFVFDHGLRLLVEP